MSAIRRCCRPSCPNRPVATLTYVYVDSTAVVGPLAVQDDPHSWDLCAVHALRITAPRGWQLVRHPDLGADSDDDLTALLDAVSEGDAGKDSVDADRLRRLGVADPDAAGSNPQNSGPHSPPAAAPAAQATPGSGVGPAGGEPDPQPVSGRPHLRVVGSDEKPIDSDSSADEQ